MWIPKDAEEIDRAARAGDLPETPSFDAKAELPRKSKNVDLATDVAAMATDGGVLLYGVAEDEHGRPTIPHPIALEGVGDRVGQIVGTSIAEVPYIDVREYPLPDDPGRGFLAVIVPQSARAPHQVTVGADLRFYGRGAKGNRRLTEAEVARLYERRRFWQVDREHILAEVIANAPVPQRPGSGHVHAFTRPVVLDQETLERAVAAAGGSGQMHQWLLNIVRSTKLWGAYGPSLEHATYWQRRGADMWRLSTRDDDERSKPSDVTGLVDLSLNIDGRGHLFCGRATDALLEDQSQTYIIEVVIAGNIEAFLAVMGALYEAAGYRGSLT